MSYFSAQKQILVGQGNVDILPYQHVFEPYLESLSKSFTTSLLVINFNGGMIFSFSISVISFIIGMVINGNLHIRLA